ncbi:MAG TPA: tetratricopeptide repeat protein [Bryobacteraceae bacterium]
MTRGRLLLLAAALIAFGASLGSGFHFDDYAIFSDPLLQVPRGLAEMWGPRQTRPLTHLTFWIDYQLGGNDPLLYHAVNLALHLGAVLLLFECLRRLLPERAAWIAAGLFAVHPLQAEAVDYVWGRSIVLAALLCFAALWAWTRERHWEAVAWFAAALLAKEECAAFPLALLLLPRDKRAPRAPIAAMLALALAAGARVIYAVSVTPGAPAGAQAGISPWHYFLAQGPAIWRYFQLLFVPYGFTVDPDVRVPPVWVGVLCWLALAAAAALAWRWRTEPWTRWFVAGVVLLLPSSSVFPAADLAADRRMYLPMLGFAAAAGLLLARVRPAWISAVAVGALALVSVFRTQVWMSDRALWSEAAERAPGKLRPKIQLARTLPAAKALEVLNEAAKLAPYDAQVPAEIGKTLLAEGQPDAALPEFGRALALDPHDARNYNNRGVALAMLGQTDAARQDFERALQIDPNLTETKQNLAKLGR